MTDDRPAAPQNRNRPLSAAYLERAALYYLERYTSSSENLRRLLLRKARRRLEPGQEIDGEITAMVAEVVERVLRSGLVDDTAYADMKVNALMRRGASTRTMRTKLLAKGVPDSAIAAAFDSHEPDEMALARRYAERKRLGPWRKGDPGPFRDKDLAALGRAGFSYAIARTVLERGVAEDEPFEAD
jgi:regulatory protein